MFFAKEIPIIYPTIVLSIMSIYSIYILIYKTPSYNKVVGSLIVLWVIVISLFGYSMHFKMYEETISKLASITKNLSIPWLIIGVIVMMKKGDEEQKIRTKKFLKEMKFLAITAIIAFAFIFLLLYLTQ